MEPDRLMLKLLPLLIRKANADGLRLSIDLPPQILRADHVVTLETQPLSLQDTLDLVHSITPNHNQTELADDGRTRFDFKLPENLWIKVSISGVAGDFLVKACQLSEH